MENAYDRRERTIYVSGMHRSVTEEHLYDLFQKVSFHSSTNIFRQIPAKSSRICGDSRVLSFGTGSIRARFGDIGNLGCNFDGAKVGDGGYHHLFQSKLADVIAEWGGKRRLLNDQIVLDVVVRCS